MANQIFPTKSNLIQTQKSLALAELGYDLMDKKRNVLVREMMTLIDKAKSIQSSIDETYKRAYECLMKANITLGICESLAEDVPIEESVEIQTKTVMGVSLPTVTVDDIDASVPYGFESANIMLDEAYMAFIKVKKLTVSLAEIESSVYRLAVAIRKTQKRANALKNIMIPDFSDNIKYISSYLEEKEREEMSRLKVIKSEKNKE